MINIKLKPIPLKLGIRKKKKLRKKKGFSLIESLISLCLFSLILIFTVDVFSTTQSHFSQLKQEEENCMAVFSALDKMRLDIMEGGRDLITPIKLRLVEGIKVDEHSLIMLSKKTVFRPLQNLVSGQTKINSKSSSQAKKGQKICIHDGKKGEIKTISNLTSNTLILSSPLSYSYEQSETSLILLRQVSLYLDKKKNILRRKVNSAPAQPLLEEVNRFWFEYKKEKNLLSVGVSLNTDQEKKYEKTIFPKNEALAGY